jgi:AICAR transformylase/IMP cyclohydrolase PurH
MEKLFIKNRKKQRIAVIVELNSQQKGLAFVMHGLSGFKEQPHVITVAEAFFERGFTIVRFDTTNTIGESDGKYEDATLTNYYQDLEDVIGWAASSGLSTYGAVAYSDSYFPETDGPGALIEKGIKVILASSGSVRDKDVRSLCQKANVTLIQGPDSKIRGFSCH